MSATPARLRGAVVDELRLTALPDGGFHLDLDRLDQMLVGARVFILNSPNNPTGWTATRDANWVQILEIARRRRVWLIADEVYSRLDVRRGGGPRRRCSISQHRTIA